MRFRSHKEAISGRHRTPNQHMLICLKFHDCLVRRPQMEPWVPQHERAVRIFKRTQPCRKILILTRGKPKRDILQNEDDDDSEDDNFQVPNDEEIVQGCFYLTMGASYSRQSAHCLIKSLHFWLIYYDVPVYSIVEVMVLQYGDDVIAAHSRHICVGYDVTYKYMSTCVLDNDGGLWNRSHQRCFFHTISPADFWKKT